MEATNRSARTLVVATLRCELLDEDGWPLASGLAALQNLPAGQSRQVRAVVYGVRSFSRARAIVNMASFQ